MKIANRLTKLGTWFKGPHSEALFELVYTEPEDFDIVVIGTGESKAVALNRALSHLEGKGVAGIYKDIYDMAHKRLSQADVIIEADGKTHNMYCIIAVSAEWQE